MSKRDSEYYSKENHHKIKENISSAYVYFQDNYKRFREFRNFVFNTSITDNQRAILNQLQKPVIESNILESYISRLLGEFSKHEPSIQITPSEGVPVDEQTLDLVEGHIRHIVYEANKNSMSYEVYKDLLSGGFSVIKVWTDYASPMSFKQIIKTGRVFDPTLCGFDPVARFSHKADGQYCFEIFPMTEEDFKREFPDANHNQIDSLRSLEEFQWFYKNDKKQKFILVADYFEKKKKKKTIVELADGKIMTLQRYKQLEAFWKEQEMLGTIIEQMPIIKNKRKTIIETICRYKLNGAEILDYEETDYSYLPLIFVDGNSIDLTHGNSASSSYQMTRPYVYQAKGIQQLKNFSMQCLANYLENIVQHKFIIKKEAIPQEEDYLDALNDIQHMNTIVVNAYCDNEPDKPIPEPIREVVNVPAPPEVMAAFQVADSTTQTVLGSYASNLGKNDNDLSGKAVIESSSVGNSASMPYVIGYLAAWTQLGCVIVDLMPKYYKGIRDLPVVSKKGEPNYQRVNDTNNENSPMLNYEDRAIKVNIEAGVNFQIQKNQALQQMTSLMQVSQEFNEFMNSQQGLPILVKNMTIYGADELQKAVPEFLQQKQQMQQQAQQMQQQAMQNDPAMIRAQAEMQKVQQQAQQAQIETQLDIARMSIDKELADAKLIEAESKVTQSQIDSAVRLEEANTSLEVHSLETAAKIAEIQSRQHNDKLNLHKTMLENMHLGHDLKQKKKQIEINE